VRVEMPYYDYECLKCGHSIEIKKGMNDPHPTTCEKCGVQALIRIHNSPASVEYKGKGWFKTDGKY
jgi:putative FmdB family regulatory protein